MTTGMPLRHLALGFALSQLGVEEGTDPRTGRYNNTGPEVEGYLRRAGIHVPAPWCAAYVFAVVDRTCELHELENPLRAIRRRALVADYHAWAEAHGLFVPAGEADRGDIVLYDFPGAHAWDHIGLLVHPVPDGGVFTAIEGNTNDDGSREGKEVAIRDDRSVDAYPVRFVRWDEGITWS